MSSVRLLLIALGTVLTASSAALASPVKLVEAKISQGCSSCADFQGTIIVENLAYAKNVAIAYQLGSREWTSFPARFKGMGEGGSQEIWEFSEYASIWLFHPLHFAIRYDVDGKTYWDNNCGQDYYLNMTAPGGSGNIRKVEGRSCR